MDTDPEAYEEFVIENSDHGKLIVREHWSISRLSRLMGLPEGIERIAKELISAYKISTGNRANLPICLASLILASRIHGFTVPVNSILSDFGVKVASKSLLRALGTLKSIIREKGVHWDSYLNYVVERVISGTKLSTSETHYLLEERLRINARRELSRILKERREDLLGKNPIHIAAVATYLAARKCGLRTPLKEIAGLLGVSNISLYRVLRVIKSGRRTII